MRCLKPNALKPADLLVVIGSEIEAGLGRESFRHTGV